MGNMGKWWQNWGGGDGGGGGMWKMRGSLAPVLNISTFVCTALWVNGWDTRVNGVAYGGKGS